MKNSKAIWTVKTECGPIREKNEDAIYPDKSGSSRLPIKAGIFDGMGGHKKGEVASLLASKVMNANFINISDYVNLANKNILDYQNKLKERLDYRINKTDLFHIAIKRLIADDPF